MWPIRHVCIGLELAADIQRATREFWTGPHKPRPAWSTPVAEVVTDGGQDTATRARWLKETAPADGPEVVDWPGRELDLHDLTGETIMYDTANHERHIVARRNAIVDLGEWQ